MKKSVHVNGSKNETDLSCTFFLLYSDEADEFVEIGALNGIFVLGRSMGFIGLCVCVRARVCDLYLWRVYYEMLFKQPYLFYAGHYLDQKRLKQGLYRHPWDDISYVLPEHMTM